MQLEFYCFSYTIISLLQCLKMNLYDFYTILPLVIKFLTTEMLMESILLINRGIISWIETLKRNSIQSNKHLLSYCFVCDLILSVVVNTKFKDTESKKNSQNIRVRRALKSGYRVHLLLGHYLILHPTPDTQGDTGSSRSSPSSTCDNTF